MKISFLSAFPPYRGGISKHSSLILSYLSERHEVQAVNFKKLYPDIFFPGKNQYDKKLEKIGNRILNSINFFSWKRTAKYILDYKPDIFIFKFWHPFFAPCYSYIIKVIKGKYNLKVIMICDNIFPHENFPFSKKIIQNLMSRVDGFIVQSSIVEKELNSLIEAPLYKKVFHPIYDNYPNSIDKNQAREKLNISESKVVLFFGFIRKYKGLDLLLNSMEEIFKKDNDIKLLIAGECYENKAKYDSIINQSNHRDKIMWIEDFIDDENVNIYFSASDVVVLPYRSASQSGIIPLSYHYNKPVITSNLESLIEVVDNYKTGIIFDLKQKKSLESAIDYFFKNDISQYDKNIYDFKAKFSWENFILEIEEISRKLNAKK